MAQIQDDYIPIQITLAAQGSAFITSVLATPNPAQQGVTVSVTNTIRNDGATDDMWVKNYVNSVQQGGTYTVNVSGGGTVFTQTWSFVMGGANANVHVEAGHVGGTLPDDTYDIIVQLLVLPEGAFTGSVTYSPGQQVEPGTDVTITYQVVNTGGAGMLWGGLYDYATPTPNLIGGYWEQAVTSAPVTKTVTVNAGQTGVDAQLLVGHFE